MVIGGKLLLKAQCDSIVKQKASAGRAEERGGGGGRSGQDVRDRKVYNAEFFPCDDFVVFFTGIDVCLRKHRRGGK